MQSIVFLGISGRASSSRPTAPTQRNQCWRRHIGNRKRLSPRATQPRCSYTVMMDGLSFEWDERKNAVNQRKHGVSFEEARTAFLDENARVIPDPEHSAGEERFVLIGLSISVRVLVVCHCYRQSDEVIR